MIVEIRTLKDLMEINNSPENLSKSYTLMNDIDVGSEETPSLSFKPIGSESNPFKGTFSGNGYTISNITFSDDKMKYVGLFGYVKGAKFYDIVLKDINVSGDTGVGGLLGCGFNVHIKGCSIENSENDSAVRGRTITGGLVGYMSKSSVSESYSKNNVIVKNSSVGGLIGSMEDHSSVFESYAAGTVIGKDFIGGLVGWMSESSVSDSYAVGNVTGSENNIGGLVGSMEEGSVFKSYATGAVTGGFLVGGLVGVIDRGSSISGSYATGAVTGTKYIGGLVGFMPDSSVSNSYATGTATGTDYVGGFVGCMKKSSVSNSYATGTATGIKEVGGLVGWMAGSDSTIAGSFYIGAPDSKNNLKGIFVTSDELKKISTFTNVSKPWDISSSPNQNSIWYINEGQDYPKLNQKNEP